MAVSRTDEKTSMVLGLEFQDGSETKVKTRTFSNVNHAVSDDDMLGVADKLVDLQVHPKSYVQRVDRASLVAAA